MKTASAFVILLSLFSSCSKNDPAPVQMLTNADMETGSAQANSWFLAHTATDITMAWTTDAASSPTHSLEISRSTIADPASYASWGQNFGGTIPVGKTVTFSIKIKGNNLQGPGVSIAIRCDGATATDLQFSTTQNVTPIVGTFDWKTYSLKLSGVQTDIKYIIVYMVYLPNTTGTVYFDDAFLQHN